MSIMRNHGWHQAFLIFATLCGLASGPVFGQNRVDQLVEQFDSLFQSDRKREAQQVMHQAVELARAQGDKRVIILLQMEANVLAGLQRLDEAEQALDEAMTLCQRVTPDDAQQFARITTGKARLFADRGKYKEAEQLYQAAIEGLSRIAPQSDLYFIARTQLGNVLQKQGRYADAEKLLLSLADGARRRDDPVPVLQPLAEVYFAQGRYGDAERYYDQCIQWAANKFGWKASYTAEVCIGQAKVYLGQLRYKAAVPMLEYALPIVSSVDGSDSDSVLVGRTMLSQCYRQLGRPADCIAQHLANIQVYERLYPDGHPQLAQELMILGYTYHLEGRLGDAIATMARAVKMSEQVTGPESAPMAETLTRFGRILRGAKKWKEAEVLLTRSIAMQKNFTVEPAVRMECHLALAEVLWETGRQDDAMRQLEQSMEFADEQRSASGGNEVDRAVLFAAFGECFERKIEWERQRGNIDEAFRAIERLRARSFLDELGLSNVDLLEGRSSEERKQILAREADLRGRIAWIEQQRDQLPLLKAREEEQKQRQELDRSLEIARAQLYDHWRSLRNSSRVYRELISADQSFLGIDQVRRQLLAPSDLLLAWFFGFDAGYVAIIDHQSARIERLAVDSHHAEALGVDAGPLNRDRLEAILMNAEGTGVVQRLSVRAHADEAIPALAILWEVLVPRPERERLTSNGVGRLIALPDGPLAFLPLEALVTRQALATEYLLDVGPPIQYGPSATVLANLSKRTPGRVIAAEPVLTLGDPAYQVGGNDGSRGGNSATRLKLSRLPYSGRESTWVSQVFNAADMQALQLLGAKATEGNLRRAIARRRVVHLACHGMSENQYGNLFGALAFAPGANRADPMDDGQLSLAEIYDLDLSACDLAILSACMTNYGPQQRGEGTWALSRGFLVAGARRVLASNWVVDDEAGASLISFFCGSIAKAHQQSTDYAGALRESKRWVRKNPKWQSPYYWATFELIGL